MPGPGGRTRRDDSNRRRPAPAVLDDVERILRACPRILFACRTRRVRDRSSGTTPTSRPAGIPDHRDERVPLSPGRLAFHMGVTAPRRMSIQVRALLERGSVTRRRRLRALARMEHRRPADGPAIRPGRPVPAGGRGLPWGKMPWAADVFGPPRRMCTRIPEDPRRGLPRELDGRDRCLGRRLRGDHRRAGRGGRPRAPLHDGDPRRPGADAPLRAGSRREPACDGSTGAGRGGSPRRAAPPAIPVSRVGSGALAEPRARYPLGGENVKDSVFVSPSFTVTVCFCAPSFSCQASTS